MNSLWRYFFTCGKDIVNLSGAWLGYKFESIIGTTGYKQCISSWQFERKKLHGETRGIQTQTQIRFGMSFQEESIWTYLGTMSMVQEFWFLHDWGWILKHWFWSLCIYEEICCWWIHHNTFCVDDMLIAGQNGNKIIKLKNEMKKHFSYEICVNLKSYYWYVHPLCFEGTKVLAITRKIYQIGIGLV